jgi:hypothetical protein
MEFHIPAAIVQATSRDPRRSQVAELELGANNAFEQSETNPSSFYLDPVGLLLQAIATAGGER